MCIERPQSFNSFVMEMNMGDVPKWLIKYGYEMRITDRDREPIHREWFWMSVIIKSLRLNSFLPFFPGLVLIYGWGVVNTLNMRSLFDTVAGFMRFNMPRAALSQPPDTMYLSRSFQCRLVLWLGQNYPLMASMIETYIRWLLGETDGHVVELYL